MYQEFDPDVRLAPYIANYWVSEGFWDNAEMVRIFPDGCVDIIINANDSNGMTRYNPYIVGTITSFLDFWASGNVKMIGIRFKPSGINAFTRIPIHEFTNKRIEVSLVDSLFDNRFYEGMEEKEVTPLQLRFIDAYLIEKLDSVYDRDPLIISSIRLITQTNGAIPIKQLSEEVCISQRHFERRFKSAVGMSAKMFSRITRFNRTKEFLKTAPQMSLFDAAVDCGYYDHAHLFKEFEFFSGSTPSKFAK